MCRKIYKIVVVIAVVCTSTFVNAQEQTARPDRGSTGNGTAHSSEIDSINLQNGSLAVQVPLASLPPMAGGKLGYTLTASYNSKLWNVNRGEEYAPQTVPGCVPIYSTETVQKADNAGWKIGGRYEVFFRNAIEEFAYKPPTTETCFGSEYYHMAGNFLKPMLRTPDGGEHELKVDGNYPQYQGSREYLARYWQFIGPGGTSPVTQPTRMYTVDGSFLTVIMNPPSFSISWTIYAKDGTRIEQSTDGQRHIDTNGNSILFGSDATDGEYALDEHTGRRIKWKADTYEGQPATRVQYQSVGGAWQSVYVVWGQTTVAGKVYAKTGWRLSDIFGDPGTTCTHHEEMGNQRLDVIRKIVFPSTEADPVRLPMYEFEYNSDATEQTTLSEPRWDCNAQTPYPDFTRAASIGWGELSKITTPTEATISYAYSNNGKHDTTTASDGANEVTQSTVTSKSVAHDGETDTWQYSDVLAGNGVTNPDGSGYSEYYYGGYNISMPAYAGGANTAGLSGLMYRSKTNRVMTEKRWITLGGTTSPYGSNSNSVGVNTVVDTEFTTLLAPDGVTRQKTSAKKFTYDYNGELKQTIEYDWFDPALLTFDGGTPNLPSAIPSGAQILRVTNNAYYNQASSSTDPNAYHKRSVGTSTVILGKLKESTVGPNTSSVKSRTRFSYDGSVWDTSAPTLGNLTDVSAYNDVGVGADQWLHTVTAYTPRGNVDSVTDPKGYVTKNIYGAVGGVTDLYPTQTVQAYGTSVGRTSAVQYDFSTGLPTLSTDVDNSVSVETVYDILGRPAIVKNAVNTPLESWTETEYSDSSRRVIVRSDFESLHDRKKVATQFTDQLGRVRLAKTLEDSATQSAENETDGIKVETKYRIDNGYSYQLTSNPFRASTSSNASSEPTIGWSRSKGWNTGRRSEVETFSGSGMPAPWGSNSNSTGVVVSEIDANATTVTDQAGKVRRSITNGVGQLTRVDEPTTSGLGTVPTPNQPTSYSYDPLGNLLTVVQAGSGTSQCGPAGGSCTQTRTFAYSSLSRLTSATNPESGTINYVYDPNGNLTRKTDARGVQTDYVYDQLNRVTDRNYSTPSGPPANYQATPNVAYTYGTITPSIGKLIKVTNGTGANASTTEYTAFDILGRVTASRQTTDGVTYGNGTTDSLMTYAYNLSGALIEQQYPSGRKVQNTLDANGDLEMVKSRKNANAGYWAYANNFTYSSAGAVTGMQLGNGRWESTQFNSRLQPTQIALGVTPNATNLLKLDYTYGTTANNGNVLTQTIMVPMVGANTGFTAVQTYSYDSVNRLKDATENVTPNGGSQTQSWKQTFTFDRFGNRRFDEANTTMPVSFANQAVTNPTISPNTNRLTSTGYSFDPAGNTIRDASDRKFTYDAENKQTKVESLSPGTNTVTGTVGEYWYDGDGRRVKKYVPSTGETTVFVYDAAGNLVAEYSSIVAPTSTAKVAYLTNDHLGSPRINTDANGAVTARHDYHPFGEEISTSQRTTGLSYAGDTVRKQFTGYERDEELDLEFARARIYSSKVGRFTSADPYNIISKKEAGRTSEERNEILVRYINQAQTWNKFAYALNNPTNNRDGGGECAVPAGLRPGQTGICVEAYIAARVIGRSATGFSGGYGDDRGRSGTDATLTARVRTKLIITPNSTDGNANTGTSHHYEWTTETHRSAAWALWVLPISAQGTSTVNITDAVTRSDGSFSATLSVNAANGFSGYGGPEGDIAFDLKLIVTPNGAVGLEEGSQSRAYPTLSIWRYSVANDGTVTAVEVKTLDEQNIDDLTKPKQAIPAVNPQ